MVSDTFCSCVAGGNDIPSVSISTGRCWSKKASSDIKFNDAVWPLFSS